MRLRWLPGAVQEAEDAVEYHERQQPGLGSKFAALLQESVAQILSNPASASPLETLPPDSGYRRRLMAKFSYLVVYRHTAEHVVIVAVAHSSRKPNYWLERDQTYERPA